MPQLCWRGYRAARDRSTVRTAGLLIEWRYGVDERLRQPSWEGLVVTVRRYGSHGWSMGVDWEPARSLSALDPLADVELESNRLHAEAARAGGPAAEAAWIVRGATLPHPCWLDERSSGDLRSPRTPAILIDHRSNVAHRGARPIEEGLLATVKVREPGRWSVDVVWWRSSLIKPIDPLADAELEASRRAASSA